MMNDQLPLDFSDTPAADVAGDVAGQAEAVPGHEARCPRCGSNETVDVRIHGGRSIRRDCRRCGRVVQFTMWYGQPAEISQEHARGAQA